MDSTSRVELRSRLLRHLQHLSCDRNPDFAPIGHFSAQQYIQQELAPLGTVTGFNFRYQSRTHTNWVLNLPGQHPRRPPILIGAHYDTVPGSPGADDNATGIAVLLELARQFATHPPQCPVQLVTFDLEEYGMLGSQAYVAELCRRHQALTLMISLEMLGYFDDRPGTQTYPAGLQALYPDRGDFIALIGDWLTIPTMVRLWWSCRQVQLPCQWLPSFRQGHPVPDTRRSDHAPFWDAGYRAIMVTDTANLRNPHYHQPSDTIATLNLERLSQVCLGLIDGIRSL